MCAIRYDALTFLGNFDLGHEKKTLVGMVERELRRWMILLFCVNVDGFELDVTVHVVLEGDILYSIVLGNNIFEKVDMLVNLLRAKFICRNNPLELRAALDREKMSTVVELQEVFSNILHTAPELSIEDQLGTEHLRENIKVKLDELIRTYRPIRPQNYPVKMKIVLSDDIPVAHRPRKMSYRPDCGTEQLEESLKDRIIQSSYSEYAVCFWYPRKM